ncbi:MAG: hypothetical protein ROO76_00855 [Terriglobia bacterium]|jgi:hypothetical protein|nr:hypothetical protein [Terriglobia bacterium]
MKALNLLLIFVVVSLAALAQEPSNPPASPTQPPTAAADDISGMYTFLKEGEFVQITVQDGIVSGFVSRYGDSDSDRDAFLDQFFTKASLKGNHLTFTTKQVHGESFDFDGTVERGPGKTPHDDAYRVIRGTLTHSAEDANGKPVAKSRQIEMKSFPQDLDEDETPRKP